MLKYRKHIKYLAIAIYVLIGIYSAFWLYFAYASFLTTFFIYSLITLFILFLRRKYLIGNNIYLILISLFVSLFLVEFFLRFIYQHPLSYNEQNGGTYVSSSRGVWIESFYLKREGHREDVHTLEFRPFEKRDIAVVEGLHRPDEIYNELGFRGPMPPKGKNAVIAFGDSFTEGACVVWEDSYPRVLEKMIHRKDSNFAVLNAGVSGNDPFFDWKMLQKLNGKFDIHTAIFLVNNTDVMDVSARGGNERFLENGNLQYRKSPWWERIYAFSFLFRLTAHNIFKINYDFMTYEESYRVKLESVEKIKNLFSEDIIPYCKKNNISLIIALHPLDWEVSNIVNDYELLRNALASIKNGNVVDCYEVIKNENDKIPLYYQYDKHFNEKGYYLLAQEIFNEFAGILKLNDEDTNKDLQSPF